MALVAAGLAGLGLIGGGAYVGKKLDVTGTRRRARGHRLDLAQEAAEDALKIESDIQYEKMVGGILDDALGGSNPTVRQIHSMGATESLIDGRERLLGEIATSSRGAGASQIQRQLAAMGIV